MMRDVYPQPDAPDPVLDDATVLTLVRRHVPAAEGVRAVDESGGEARTYAVDDAIILKTQRPHRLRPRTSLEKETLILGHLAACHPDDPLPLPRIYGYGKEPTPHGTVEYICMSRVPGVAAQGAGLAGPARSAVLSQLGAVLARVHAVPPALFMESALVPGDRSPADLAARVDAAFASLLEALRQASGRWPGQHTPAEVATAARRHTARHELGTRPPALATLHSNPSPVHTFVDPDSRIFSGLIDFGDAYLSHPAFDLVRWPDATDRAALLDGYRSAGVPASAGAGDDAFVAIWRIACLLADLQAAVRSPARAPQAAVQIDRLMELL